MPTFESYTDFAESDMFDDYEGKQNECFELIQKNILLPKNSFEFYVNCMDGKLSKETIKKFITEYGLDINSLYNFPTDSHEEINLLGCLCEYRIFENIKDVLELGANPNTIDSIGYTPFQSLISGHSCTDIGKNKDEIKTVIEMFLSYGANLILEKWQYDEHYLPYTQQDNYFVDLLDKITIIENINN